MQLFLKTLSLLLLCSVARGQASSAYADSVRQAYHIPELAYAVVSADAVLEFQVLGVQRLRTSLLAKPNDRFHLGSNTKAVTAFLAAVLVKQGKVAWDTPFLTLFPELKATSRSCYRHITL